MYTPSGEVSAAMAFKGGLSFSQATSRNTSALVTLGTQKYTVIMHCPILSHLGISNAFSSINGQQPSGFAVVSFTALTENFDFSFFFGTGFSGASLFPGPLQSMNQMYGFNSTATLETYVYSSQVDLSLVVPAANLTGTAYQGTLRLGQFFNSTTTTASQSISLGALIRSADSIHTGKQNFTLSSAVVNDYIATHTIRNGEDVITSSYLTDVSLGAEIIDYIVLVSPAVNITTGADSTFSIIGEFKANALVLPSIGDFLLYRTFPTLNHHKQKHEMDFSYSRIPTKILEKYGPPTSYHGLAKLMGAMETSNVVLPQSPPEPSLNLIQEVISDYGQNSDVESVDIKVISRKQ